MKIFIPSQLTNAALLAEVKRLARCERDATVALVAHLAELDARRLYRGAGFSSLFMYCWKGLSLSENEAYTRMRAARAARQFPIVLDRLAEGTINLTTIRLVAPHLTSENHRELLSAVSGRSKRDVQELLARRFPQDDVPSSIRKLRASPPSPNAALSREATGSSTTLRAASTPGSAPLLIPPAASPEPAPSPSPPRREVVQPLAPDRYEVRFTATADTCEKLQLARDMLRHAVPSGDMAEIFDRALTALLQDLARAKFAATDRPRHGRPRRADSRCIPAHVKRAVWLRDLGRCAFRACDGRRCGERSFVEFHHVQPYGAGGEATVANIQLRCRAHNAYEAEVFYGTEKAAGRGVVRETGPVYGQGMDRRTGSGTSSPALAATEVSTRLMAPCFTAPQAGSPGRRPRDGEPERLSSRQCF